MDKKRKLDSRIIRSKRDLANSFEELLQEKNLDDISITEITDRAMVSKNTFYNNFEDKSDLLNFIFTRYEEKLDDDIQKIVTKYEGDRKKAIYEIIKKIVNFFYSSNLSFKNMVKNDKSKTLYWSVNSFIKELIEKIIHRSPDFFTLNEIPTTFISYIYSGAMSNMMYYMYSEDTKISESDCAEYIYSILSPLIKE